MTKPKSNTRNARQQLAHRASKVSKPKAKGCKQAENSKEAASKRSVQQPAKVPSRPNTKQARILEMLRSPAGVTIASLAGTMNWQPHSVRGFLAGTVRKKLKLNLTSEPGKSGRIYRIMDAVAGSVPTTRAA